MIRLRQLWRKFRSSQRGSSMVETLFLYPLMVFLAFTPILLDLTAGDQGFLETMKDKHLQKAQLNGGFTTASWNDLKADLQTRGLDYAKVHFDGSSPVGVPIVRGEKISLSIGYPRGNGLSIFALIGVSFDPNHLVWAKGSILSEKPRP